MAAPVLVAAAVLVASIAYGSARAVTAGAVASVLLLLAALVAVAAGLTMVVRWRLAGSALAARQGAALCVLAAAIVVGRGAVPGGATGTTSRLALLVALGVGALLLRAAVGPEVDTVTSPGRDVVVAAVGTLVLAAGLRWGLGPATTAEAASELAVAALVWGGVAVAVRRVGAATPWGVPAAAPVGLGLSAACRSMAQLTGWSWLEVVAATSTFLALCWVLARSWWELQASVSSGDRQQRHLHLDLRSTRDLLVQHHAYLEEHLHDVRNAVAGMRTADLTLRRYGPMLDTTRRAMLADAVSCELDRLQALIEPGRAPADTTFDLADHAAPVIAGERVYGTDLDVELDGYQARGDGLAFAQALQNLLVNARRYAPGSPVSVRACEWAGTVEVRVQDRGPGIPDQERLAIFGRGQRGSTASDVTGDGLGLYISARLLSAAGGTLRLEPSDDGGACFVIELPPAPGSEAADSKARGLEEVNDLAGPGQPLRQADDDARPKVVGLAGVEHGHVDGRRPRVARLVDDPPAASEVTAEHAGEQRGADGHHHGERVRRHGASVAPGEVVLIPKMDEAR